MREVTKFGSNGVILRAPIGQSLTLEMIRQKAPSVFAEEKHTSCSEKFVYIPTYELLASCIKEGFLPMEVRQGGSRDVEKRAFTKHLIRFRREGSCLRVGDSFPEIVMINAHDKTSAVHMLNGWFELTCMNGNTVSQGEGQSIHIPHRGDIIGEVIEAAYTVLKTVDEQREKVAEMQHLMLTGPEQEVFARAAIPLRFEVDKEVAPASVLRPRRYADDSPSLWKTFQRVQENMIRGGVRTVAYNEQNRRVERRSRAVNGISEDVRLNQQLWTLAESMRQLKTA